ncbi:MAG TPA: hypothetical protein VEX39_00765 [Thermoleophilaceae bacterium]|nr:hypothetical protein [Thermoleophilaceae bacterium]
MGRERRRQHAADRSQRAAERQLPADGGASERFGGHLTAGHEDADGQGEVEAGTGLAHRRGREVRGDPLQRELQARVQKRGTDALPGLAHRRVRKPHDGERGEPATDIDLRGDLTAVDAFEGECGDAGKHTTKLGLRL